MTESRPVSLPFAVDPGERPEGWRRTSADIEESLWGPDLGHGRAGVPVSVGTCGDDTGLSELALCSPRGTPLSPPGSGGQPPPVDILLRSAARWSVRERSVCLQKWEGVVVSSGSDSFFARLVDLTGDTPDEEVEIPREEVSASDCAHLREGAAFYWTIGYSDSVKGQRRRVSEIRFRRLPAWTEEDIQRAEREAEEFGFVLGSR